MGDFSLDKQKKSNIHFYAYVVFMLKYLDMKTEDYTIHFLINFTYISNNYILGDYKYKNRAVIKTALFFIGLLIILVKCWSIRSCMIQIS